MKFFYRKFPSGLIAAAVLVLTLRALLSVVGASLTVHFNQLPLTTSQMNLSNLIPPIDDNTLHKFAQPFHRFDALWYEAVGHTGYVNLPAATAFFPLYPRIVTAISTLFNSPFYVTAFFFNTGLMIFILWLFYRLVSLEYGESTALGATIVYAVFPTSFFFLAPYAEALLMVFIFAALLSALKKKYLLASVLGMCAAMTKPYGFMVAIPLALIVWQEKKILFKMFRLLLLALIPLGTALIIYDQTSRTGAQIPATSAAITYWRMTLVNPISNIWASVGLFIRNPYDLPNILNFIAVILTLFCLISNWKQSKKYYWWFVLTLFLIFSSYQITGGVPLKSQARYILMLFPLFIWLSQKITGNISYYIYIITSSTLMLFFFIYYTFGFFVF